MTFSHKNSATLIAKSKIESTLKTAKNLVSDPDKENRIKSHLCKCCHYIAPGGMVMHAFTKSNCVSCTLEMSFPNSSVDRFHLACAADLGVCKKCGADVSIDGESRHYDAIKSCGDVNES